MSVTVRKAEEKDIPAIQNLVRAVLEESDEAALKRLFNRVYSEEALQKSLRSTGASMILAEVDSKVAGLCQFGSPLIDDCEDRKEIHRLYVHPDYLKEGVGEALVKAVEADLNADAAIKRVSVYVNPETQMTMVRFYAAQGFHHDQIEDKDDEWYMEKPVKS
jgi:N-acetylglutamate synthase-like GNAT family acetyltransferase